MSCQLRPPSTVRTTNVSSVTFPTTLAHHVVADAWVNCARKPTSAGGDPTGFEGLTGSTDPTGLDATGLDNGALVADSLSTGELPNAGALVARTALGIADGCDAGVMDAPHAAALTISATAPITIAAERSIPITSGQERRAPAAGCLQADGRGRFRR